MNKKINEAAFSYQKDLRDGTVRCYRDYARIWSWTKNKAIGFIRDKQGTKTEQAKDTQGTVKFRWVKPSRESKGQARDEQGTKPGQARDTTNNKIERKNKKNYSDAFLLFWKTYPRKENKVDDKSDAYKEWSELNPDSSLVELILSALEKYKRSESWKELKGRYIPNAAKWLRNRKWEDEPTEKPSEETVADRFPRILLDDEKHSKISKEKLEKISSMNLDAFNDIP